MSRKMGAGLCCSVRLKRFRYCLLELFRLFFFFGPTVPVSLWRLHGGRLTRCPWVACPPFQWPLTATLPLACNGTTTKQGCPAPHCHPMTPAQAQLPTAATPSQLTRRGRLSQSHHDDLILPLSSSRQKNIATQAPRTPHFPPRHARARRPPWRRKYSPQPAAVSHAPRLAS